MNRWKCNQFACMIGTLWTRFDDRGLGGNSFVSLQTVINSVYLRHITELQFRLKSIGFLEGENTIHTDTFGECADI